MPMSLHRSQPWTARIVAGLVLCVPLAALADEAASAGQHANVLAPSAASSRSSASRRTNAAARSTAANGAARSVATAPASTTPANATTPAPSVICFQTSLRCFTPTHAAPSTASAPRANNLDLRAPELSRVFSQAELAQKLEDPDEAYDVQETVQVQGERQLPQVSAGLMAIPWAVIHPTQAWRILMPVPDAK
jgi:hypothetical protein